jgi:hypothetical protein
MQYCEKQVKLWKKKILDVHETGTAYVMLMNEIPSR